MSSYRINLNEMDIELAKQEGGKESLSIAQIKEVRRLVCEYLGARGCEDGIDGVVTVLHLLRSAFNASDEIEIDKEDNVPRADG